MEKIKITRDLKKVRGLMAKIDKNQSTNYPVAVQNYLDPWTFSRQPLSMNDSLGLFVYYKRISETLLLALEEGTIPRRRLPCNSPQYLLDLAV